MSQGIKISFANAISFKASRNFALEYNRKLSLYYLAPWETKATVRRLGILDGVLSVEHQKQKSNTQNPQEAHASHENGKLNSTMQAYIHVCALSHTLHVRRRSGVWYVSCVCVFILKGCRKTSV
jgi:glycyl-tRNA synthetase beta subunit